MARPTLTTADWRQLLHLFDHTQRLDAEDRDLFVERPDAVVQRIANDIAVERPYSKGCRSSWFRP